METVVHDFSLVEEAMRTLQRQAEKRSKATSLALWLPKLGTVAIGVGLGVALALAGFSLAREASHAQTEVRADHFPKFPKSEDIQPTPQNSKREKVVTDFVIFNNVETALGRVETGWHYANENQTRPDEQWCQFVSFGVDGMGRITPYKKLSKDLSAKCRWFLGVAQND